MNNPQAQAQAQANRMHVRRLLNEKQPGFAAALESVARELELEYEVPDACVTKAEP